MWQLKQHVHRFLKERSYEGKPLLIGFSGGVDSLALVHVLRELSLCIELAHFDHGWRPLSGAEALNLKQIAEKSGLVFHTARGEARQRSELSAREERYVFFEMLFQTGKYEALVLAHHRDDQVETVLKRVLEGASLCSLKAMESVSTKGKLLLWRPFLEIPKTLLQQYAEHHQLKPIEDYTNEDTKYLRNRMRKEIIPQLCLDFGKEVGPALLRLSSYAKELEIYLEKKRVEVQRSQLEGPFGIWWDFTLFPSLEAFELRSILKEFFGKKGVSLSAFSLTQMVELVQKKAPHQRVSFGQQTALFDRGSLFFFTREPPSFPDLKTPFIDSCKIESGLWKWEVSLISNSSCQSSTSWKDLLAGKSLICPISSQNKGETLYLRSPNPKSKKWWNTCKVPAFLRATFPILVDENERLIGEFLTGKKDKKEKEGALFMKVTLKARD